MGDEQGASTEEKRNRLDEWVRLQEQYDRELSRRFADAVRGGGPAETPAWLIDREFDELAHGVRQAKAAYDAARGPRST